ncbi:MAG TPA: LacI family DNA-binding transcriptional regulator [Microlunatus sp.]|nr:LacI family DNA-binding transcriptional regulator [Microlunatus sp.]
MSRPRRLTSVDVAREAGVSRATVSYVLNDTPNQRIPEATRQRVWEAVARLGYTPSANARSLRSGRSEIVLWLLPDWPIGRMLGSVLEAIALALAEQGLILVAHPRAGNRRPIAEVWRAISPAVVLLWGPLSEADEASLRAAGVRATVALMDSSGASETQGLVVSEQRTGRLQAEHLAARGHRRIGYAYPDDRRVFSFAEPRLTGVRTACAELGLDAPDVVTVGLDRDSGEAAVDHWISGPDPVTAVCAYNDETALAVLAGLRVRGLRAPDDLAVIGVDDLPISALYDPPLSTVVVDAQRLARYVVAAVLAGLADEPAPPFPSSDLINIVARASA